MKETEEQKETRFWIAFDSGTPRINLYAEFGGKYTREMLCIQTQGELDRESAKIKKQVTRLYKHDTEYKPKRMITEESIQVIRRRTLAKQLADMNGLMMPNAIRRIRISRGMTCRELSSITGLHHDVIFAAELRGNRLSDERIIDIARALEVSVETLEWGNAQNCAKVAV